MKKILSILLAGCFLSALAEEEDEYADFDRFYVGGTAALLLPGNGNTLNERGAYGVRAGWYLEEDLAVEGTFQYAEGLGGAGAGVLWHWFGYERLDPFFTCGVQSFFGDGRRFGDGRHRTGAGPCVGAGAFWHLTEHWSLRVDFGAALGFDSPCSMVYSVGLGLQCSFGGGE